MESGVYPAEGFKGRPLTQKRLRRVGKPLAAGWRASLSCTLAAAKEKVKVHKYCRNYAAKFLCEKCLASRHMQDGNAYDFRDNVLWRRLLVSYRLYLESTAVADRSPWCASKTWGTHRHKDDLLHGWWLGFIKAC